MGNHIAGQEIRYEAKGEKALVTGILNFIDDDTIPKRWGLKL